MEPTWKKFNALGTEIVLSAYLKADERWLLDIAQKIIFDFEKKFSRFIKDNELQRFNGFAGGEFEPSEMLLDILGQAQKLHHETNGIFDPTVIESLEAIGYAKNFIDIKKEDDKDRIDTEKIKKDFLKRPRFENLKITGRKIIVPKGLRVDLGGIGKGYIADYLAKTAFCGIENFWISIGGDILIQGGDAGKIGWKVGIQDPTETSKEIFSIDTKGKRLGIATSGILKRKGRTGGIDWHHLIDPKTALPAENEVLAVTAISSTATRADVLTKTVLLLGEKQGLEFIDGIDDTVCVIFLKDGSPVFSKGALNYS